MADACEHAELTASVRQCTRSAVASAKAEAGNWRSDFTRACSVHAFWLSRVTKGVSSQRRMSPRTSRYTREQRQRITTDNFPAWEAATDERVGDLVLETAAR